MFTPRMFGKYFLYERLAVGGMAEIFKAKMFGVDGFEKNMVVKQILPQYARNREFIQMFIDEAKITVSLSHGNVVPVYELGQIEGIYFIAMEHIDGKNLGELLDACLEHQRVLSVPQALHICSEVLAGLDYAHRKTDEQGQPLHIVHRDVSPQNILISFDGEVKIVDFGIARAATKIHETRSGVIKGKFGYMSPEQANGEVVDARSDVFALGILLFEMLTLERLFAGDNDVLVLERVKRADVPTPSRINPRLPPEVDAIFFKAVALNPKDRYQSAGDMRQAVSRLLYQMPEEASSKTLSHFVQALFAEEFERRRNQPPVQIPEPQSAMASVGESAPPPVKPASPAGLLDGFPSSGLPLRPLPGDGEEVIDDDFSYLKAGRRAKWMVLLSLIILLVVGGVFFGSDLVRVFSTIGDVIDESAQRLAQKKLGTLLVRSRPTGATVYFGGRMQGSTDMRIKSIDPTREYELVMTLEGFGSWSRKILPADWQQDKERMLIEVFKDFSQQ